MLDTVGLLSAATNIMAILGVFKVGDFLRWLWDQREKKKEARKKELAELKQAQEVKDKLIREALNDWSWAALSLRILHRNMWCCLGHHDKDEDDGFYWEGEPYGEMWGNLGPSTQTYKSARIKLLTLGPKPDLTKRVNDVHDVFLSTIPISPGTMSVINYASATGPNIAAMDDLEEVLEDITIKGNK